MPWKNEATLDSVSETFKSLLISLHNADDEISIIFLKDLITRACRKIELYIEPRYSVKAELVANEMKIGCLSQYQWNDQNSKRKDKGRKVFHWEHILPVSTIVKKLLAIENPTNSAIIDIIKNADVAWILKAENDQLDSNGYRTKRPENPLEAYINCDIQLV